MEGMRFGRDALRLRGKHDRDEGVALVVVVGTMMVLAMLATVALAYSLAGQRFARYDQDYSAAMSAAQSGIDDFISRLNRAEVYGDEVDCTNEAWRGPMKADTNECGWNTTTAVGWLPVKPGETDPEAAHFHYAVDASEKRANGTVVLQVTGRVNGVYRTVETTVGKGGSTDYVYYTDFESADPDNVQAYPPNGATSVACGSSGYGNARHWWEGRSGCKEITFISGDVLDGAVFTNDTILSDGASFLKGVKTANPNCASAGSTPSSWNAACLRSGSTANFNGTKPRYSEPLSLDDNTGTFRTNPGCHYYGSTRVIFDASGTMTVWNRASVSGGIEPVAIAAPGKSEPTCGSADQLENGQTLPVPDGLVIYTHTVGGTTRQCYGGEIGGPSGRELPLGTYSSSTPTTPSSSSSPYTYDRNMAETTKYCGEGNLYAEGVLKGRVTIAAEQSVVVTGDLVLARGLNDSDMLGLVATNSVEVFHPRMVTVSPQKVSASCHGSGCAYKWGSAGNEQEAHDSDYNEGTWPTRYKEPGAGSYTPSSGIQIAGSIQTLQHSFLVQMYDKGSNKGQLLVNGSIAQRWRGIVGQTDGGGMHGYTKLYKYDNRLIYSRPPYFPTWANAEWTARYSGEINTSADVKG